MSTYEDGLRIVGEAQYCNGFMAATIRVGQLLIENPRLTNKELLDTLTADYKALPGFKISPEAKSQ